MCGFSLTGYHALRILKSWRSVIDMLFATEQSIAAPNAVTAPTTPFPMLKPPLVALGTGLDVVFSIRGPNPNFHPVSYF